MAAAVVPAAQRVAVQAAARKAVRAHRQAAASTRWTTIFRSDRQVGIPHDGPNVRVKPAAWPGPSGLVSLRRCSLLARQTVADELPDLIAPHLDVLFCGINPGLTAAATGHHFAGRSNRFWRVIHLAGFTPAEISPQDDRAILQYGCGLTAVVKRPTASADQLSRAEFIAAAAEFDQKLARYAPRFVAFLGKAAYSALSGQREIEWGCNRPGCRGERLGAAQSERAKPRVQSRRSGRRIPSASSAGEGRFRSPTGGAGCGAVNLRPGGRAPCCPAHSSTESPPTSRRNC